MSGATATATPGWRDRRLPSPAAEPEALPCWLTEEETEALIMLCATSRLNGGKIEREIFGKLGDLIRAFRR